MLGGHIYYLKSIHQYRAQKPTNKILKLRFAAKYAYEYAEDINIIQMNQIITFYISNISNRLYIYKYNVQTKNAETMNTKILKMASSSVQLNAGYLFLFLFPTRILGMPGRWLSSPYKIKIQIENISKRQSKRKLFIHFFFIHFLFFKELVLKNKLKRKESQINILFFKLFKPHLMV